MTDPSVMFDLLGDGFDWLLAEADVAGKLSSSALDRSAGAELLMAV